MEVNTQKGGDGSRNVQAGNVTVNVVALVRSVEEMVPEVFEAAFGALSTKSQEEARTHQEDFMKGFQSKLEAIAGDVDALKHSVEKPDFQYVAKKSLVASGRMESGEKRKLLASLLGDRLNTRTDFGEIVYNEALDTIPKLTDRQIKMLALQCSVGQVSQSNVSNWETYSADKKALFEYVLPLNFQQSDLQHISYSGCGAVGPFAKDLVGVIKEKYENLFLKPIKADDPIYAEIMASPIVGLFYTSDEGLHFGANKKSFEKVTTSSNLDKELVDRILPLYDSQVMNDTEALEAIHQKCFKGADLIDAWETKQLKHLSPTSVGIIIGVSVMEEIDKSKVQKDDWLGLDAGD